ncbi:MAG: response regulator transcription factor [Planctomycetota bacterium]
MSTVLVVEDEAHLAVGLRFNLENAGYVVRLVDNGKDALQQVEGADLVLLDVNLPGGQDGFEIAREIRKAHNFVPIIMLSARNQKEDRIRGLDAGADDYLTKPFDLEELLARLRGHLRRQVWHRRDEDDGEAPNSGPASLEFGQCTIDFRTLEARDHRGEDIQLSWKEAMIMRLFLENEGEVIPRSRFLEDVWGEPGTLETRTVDNFIMRLRRYFEPDPKKPKHILSVRGVGYRFVR